MTNRQRLLQTSEYDLLSYVQLETDEDACVIEALNGYFGKTCHENRCKKFRSLYKEDEGHEYGDVCNYCIAMWLNEEA